MSPWKVAVAFVPVEASQNPNLKREDSHLSYYRAMTVTFASLRRWNPTLPLELVTNAEPPREISTALAQFGVNLRLAEFRHLPPQGFAKRFAASLYMLDAMAACVDESTLFLDPDVVCIRDITDVLAGLDQRIGALPMPYPADYDVNGLSPRQAGELHSLLGEPIENAEHFGGECWAIPASLSAVFLARAERAWQLSLHRFASGDTRFTTEEHLLSYAVRGLPPVSMRPHVKRIWTAARYRTVDGTERSLKLWHLPAEKDHGFQALYKEVIAVSSWFWTAPAEVWTDRAAGYLGVDHRQPGRLLRDTVGRIAAFLRI